MELINQTPVPADVTLHSAQPEERIGLITAKATFRYEGGAAELDRDEPLPVLRADEPTTLGVLPCDIVFHTDPHMQVMLLGCAHAPGGEAAAMDVSLQVGGVRHALRVIGDRRWVEPEPGEPPGMTEPEPFARMPLTWERAYGGRREVEIDREAFVEVSHPANPYGRGFDAAPHVDGLVEALQPPEGYPRWDRARPLPNVEDAEAPIVAPGDDPLPCCWAPLVPDVPLRTLAAVRRLGDAASVEEGARRFEEELGGTAGAVLATLLRAHPDWTIPIPPPGASVRMEGLSAAGVEAFELPQVRVLADYVVGDRAGTRELIPQVLLLLPEERRVAIVYRGRFRVAYEPDLERAFRLRLEPGWYTPVGAS